MATGSALAPALGGLVAEVALWAVENLPTPAGLRRLVTMSDESPRAPASASRRVAYVYAVHVFARDGRECEVVSYDARTSDLRPGQRLNVLDDPGWHGQATVTVTRVPKAPGIDREGEAHAVVVGPLPAAYLET